MVGGGLRWLGSHVALGGEACVCVCVCVHAVHTACVGAHLYVLCKTASGEVSSGPAHPFPWEICCLPRPLP